MKIQGSIGPWPVDLNIELDESEWARLAGVLQGSPLPASAPVVAAVPQAPVGRPVDHLWATACELLRKAGSISGPELLDQLTALSGDGGAGKRLLVRLRHSAEVRVESGADAPQYHWVGQ